MFKFLEDRAGNILYSLTHKLLRIAEILCLPNSVNIQVTLKVCNSMDKKLVNKPGTELW